MRVGIIGYGEVGRLISNQFLSRGRSVLVWDKCFLDSSSPALQLAAGTPGLDVASSSIDLIERADLIFSAVTAGNALQLASDCAKAITQEKTFVDLNSVSPGTKVQMAEVMAAASGRFVEAAIMSPIHPRGIESPISLAGPHAELFAEIGASIGFTSLTISSPTFGKAAATKMCRSVVIKGLEALIAESMMAARAHGVEDVVLGSFKNLLPRDDWPDYAHYMIQRTLLHGVRRAEEMSEAAKTLSEIGVDPLMTRATVERQNWMAGRVDTASNTDLAATLDALLQNLDTNIEESK